MNKAIYFATFAAGAVIGSVASWQILKRKYEKIVQEEVDSVKKAFRNISDEQVEVKEEEEDEFEYKKVDSEQKTMDMKQYAELLAKLRYNEGNTKYDPAIYSDPYVITPEEFAENDDYEVLSVFYHADGKLADADGNIIEIYKVGEDSLDRIGEYEDDCIHVRNDQLKTDYEILLDPRNYSEVYKK